MPTFHSSCLRPFGIAVDSKGKIYVADQSVGAIFIFSTENSDVELIRNKHEASFGLIYGLAIDDNDRLFVTDLKLRHVAVINAKHQEEAAFGADVLGRPGGVAIDTENRLLYVVDTENDVVDVFDADSFKLLRHIGTPGKKHALTEPGTFSLPSSVAVDKDGNVFVTDTFNDRVEIFDADGNFISTFGKNGDGPGYFERPKGIAIDGDGHIWVVDGAQDRVQVFNQEGRLLIYFGEHGEWPGMFMQANDITIDKQNRVFVSEQFLGRVQMFRYVTDAEADQERKERETLRGKTNHRRLLPKPTRILPSLTRHLPRNRIPRLMRLRTRRSNSADPESVYSPGPGRNFGITALVFHHFGPVFSKHLIAEFDMAEIASGSFHPLSAISQSSSNTSKTVLLTYESKSYSSTKFRFFSLATSASYLHY